ncbi:MAG TPA: hypothetical protein VMC09_02280 [Anaerolineales bacterium]|nr:hypothetical protein [Anaerolineales bacterium]
MKRSIFFLGLCLILLAACGPAAPSTPTVLATSAAGVLSVDPKQDLGPISPYLYGSNYGPWTAVPADMLQEAFNSHVTVLRWPGGAWGDQNDIQTYQLDAFIAFCKQMGAIPTISVGFQNATPETAAALVRYANIEMGYKITYWSIGNEPDIETLDGKKIDPVYYNKQWRAIALAMKAVDPKVKILGPEISQWGTDLSKTPKYPPVQTPTGQERQDWMTEFLKANGDLVDIVAVHRYPLYSPSLGPIQVDQLRQETLEWNQMVVYLRTLIHDTTGRDIPIAFTEVNSDPSPALGGVGTPDSFYNAIWYADVLGRLMSEHVFMVNQFVLANRQGGLGLIYGSQLRPTYYVFQMYSRFGTEQVYAASGVPEVTVYAARSTDGTLTIMVINLADSDQKVPLQVKGVTLSSADVWRFDLTHNATDLGTQKFSADGILDLPAQSISLYLLGK